MESHIILKGMRFYAYHGVGEQERTVGNEYYLDLRLKADIALAAQTDEVSDTVNYAEVYASVKQEMDIPSKLLEHVAHRIVQRLFHDYPAIQAIRLKLMKRNPPMGADLHSAGIEIQCDRKES